MKKILKTAKSVKSALIYYSKTTDLFLVFLAVSASFLSFLLLWSQYPKITPSPRTLIVQVCSSFVGLIIALTISNFDYHIIAKKWKIIAIAAVVFSLTPFTPLGTLRGGNDMSGPGAGSENLNWINIGFTKIQPSEFLKVAFILTFSYHCFKKLDEINKPRVLGGILAHACVPISIIFLQKDYGTMLIFISIAAFILFASKINWKVISIASVFILILLLLFSLNILPTHLQNRIKVLGNLEEEKRGLGMQQYRGLITLAFGGIFGKGLKFEDMITNTPEPYNDMIFSHLGQTLGFVGCTAVLIWIFVFCIKILINARRAPDNLGCLICVGVFSVIFSQALVNIGMVLCLTPVIGVSLPFISGGGSGVVASYILLGLVLNIYKHTYKPQLF